MPSYNLREKKNILILYNQKVEKNDKIKEVTKKLFFQKYDSRRICLQKNYLKCYYMSQ
jgi:hypothetical protein